MDVLLLTIALIAYAALLNLWRPFNRGLYVPLNAALILLLAWIARGPLELSLGDLGLADLDLRHALLGALLGAGLSSPVVGAARAPRLAARIADERVGHLSGWALAYQILIRVPVGTAATEELAFRGVLFAAWLQHGLLAAWLVSSVAFGLWHISPTINLMRANRPDASTRAVVRAVITAVMVTSLAGAVLTGLRRGSSGLLLPWALHAAVNSTATIAAVVAHRTLEPRR